MEKLGERVAYYRKSKGLSIKDLAENLCDDSTIYRLEKGRQLPRLEILNEICMKLEVPINALFPLNKEVVQLKMLCREFTYNEDYLSLELTLEECENVLEQLTSIYEKKQFSRFILWHRAILLHKIENKEQDALKILNSIVNLKKCGSELDIEIMNSTALIYLTTDVNTAYKIYKEIYAKSKNQKDLEDLTLFPRVGYNYAYTMYQLNSYEKALKIVLDVLNYMETHHLMYFLGEIYHMIGILSKKNEYFIEAEEAFKNAILVFTLTKDKNNLTRVETDLSKLHMQNKKVVLPTS
ncbi:helix-turn-helix domain-containing protein [Lysinibacillus xylanilyticus]|uniref:helix-turn-helix domain-containing protein n=1 Tax=Lysinibacillus xylanilyticus TaxID=582475 RepID=UPI002B2506A3|nr:helix-turn-helix domain-containing protein [Lysinibacillus xylanilyticus]MEB2282497.1 helix-turn-helix domain-containing protein [Lysinibacillus xylanilyticus]